MAFAPLSKNLTCGTSCAPENVSFVWTFSTRRVNATFRYNIFPHEVHGSNVRYESVDVLADGTLHIGTVKKAHYGDYICTASFSNGTVCGIAERTLMVTQLCKLFSLMRCPDFVYMCALVTTVLFGQRCFFLCMSLFCAYCSTVTGLTQSPDFRPKSDKAIYGRQSVLCIDGDSPGIEGNGTLWEKTNVVTVNVNDISSECLSKYPTSCYSCENRDSYLSLPTVINRMMDYEYSAFVIASRRTDHNECLEITNRYVNFLIINQVKEEDKGNFIVEIESGYNAKARGPYTLTPCELFILLPHITTLHV